MHGGHGPPGGEEEGRHDAAQQSEGAASVSQNSMRQPGQIEGAGQPHAGDRMVAQLVEAPARRVGSRVPELSATDASRAPTGLGPSLTPPSRRSVDHVLDLCRPESPLKRERELSPARLRSSGGAPADALMYGIPDSASFSVMELGDFLVKRYRIKVTNTPGRLDSRLQRLLYADRDANTNQARLLSRAWFVCLVFTASVFWLGGCLVASAASLDWAARARVFRYTALVPGQSKEADRPLVADFGLLLGGCRGSAPLSTLVQGSSIVQTFDEPVTMNGWWFKPLDDVPLGTLAHFRIEALVDEAGKGGEAQMVWQVVGLPHISHTVLLRLAGVPVPLREEWDLRPVWSWYLGTVGGDILLGVAFQAAGLLHFLQQANIGYHLLASALGVRVLSQGIRFWDMHVREAPDALLSACTGIILFAGVVATVMVWGRSRRLISDYLLAYTTLAFVTNVIEEHLVVTSQGFSSGVHDSLNPLTMVETFRPFPFVAIFFFIVMNRFSELKKMKSLTKRDDERLSAAWSEYLSKDSSVGDLQLLAQLVHAVQRTVEGRGSGRHGVRQCSRQSTAVDRSHRPALTPFMSIVVEVAGEGQPGQLNRAAPIRSLDQLYAQASGIQSFLRNKAKQFAGRSGGYFVSEKEPHYLRWESSMQQDDPANLQVLWTETKPHERALQKAHKCYHGDVSLLLDISREAIFFDSAADITHCLKLILKDSEIVIERVRNRLDPRMDQVSGNAGHRCLVLNLRIDFALTRLLGIETHVCELQLGLRDLHKVQTDLSHRNYLRLRNVRDLSVFGLKLELWGQGLHKRSRRRSQMLPWGKRLSQSQVMPDFPKSPESYTLTSAQPPLDHVKIGSSPASLDPFIVGSRLPSLDEVKIASPPAPASNAPTDVHVLSLVRPMSRLPSDTSGILPGILQPPSRTVSGDCLVQPFSHASSGRSLDAFEGSEVPISRSSSSRKSPLPPVRRAPSDAATQANAAAQLGLRRNPSEPALRVLPPAVLVARTPSEPSRKSSFSLPGRKTSVTSSVPSLDDHGGASLERWKWAKSFSPPTTLMRVPSAAARTLHRAGTTKMLQRSMTMLRGPKSNRRLSMASAFEDMEGMFLTSGMTQGHQGQLSTSSLVSGSRNLWQQFFVNQFKNATLEQAVFMDKKMKKINSAMAKASAASAFFTSTPIASALSKPFMRIIFTLLAAFFGFQAFLGLSFWTQAMALEATAYRYTALGTRDGIGARSPGIDAFGIMRGGCRIDNEPGQAVRNSSSITLSLSKPTQMDGWWITTSKANFTDEGVPTVEQDPAYFLIEALDSGEWAAVGTQDTQKLDANGLRQLFNESYTMPLSRSTTVVFDLGNTWSDPIIVIGTPFIWTLTFGGLVVAAFNGMHTYGKYILCIGFMSVSLCYGAAFVSAASRGRGLHETFLNAGFCFWDLATAWSFLFFERKTSLVCLVCGSGNFIVWIVDALFIQHSWLALTRELGHNGCFAVTLYFVITFRRVYSLRKTQKLVEGDCERYQRSWQQVMETEPGVRGSLKRLSEIASTIGGKGIVPRQLNRERGLSRPNRSRSFENILGLNSSAETISINVDSVGVPGTMDPNLPVKSLDQLYAQASGMHLVLLSKVQAWALAAEGSFFTKNGSFARWSEACSDPEVVARIKWGALKNPGRSIEKILRVYKGDPSFLLDICRQAIVFRTVAQIESCLRTITQDRDVAAVRIKNRLDPAYDALADSAGYRDVLINVRIDNPLTRGLGIESHICEVQLMLEAFCLQKNEAGHKRYVEWRDIRGL